MNIKWKGQMRRKVERNQKYLDHMEMNEMQIIMVQSGLKGAHIAMVARKDLESAGCN